MQYAVRVGLVYLISGFGGSLMSALFIQSSVSVGASRALFGLVGSMLSELITVVLLKSSSGRSSGYITLHFG
jgi:membrane associated rhomboid family serine protease